MAIERLGDYAYQAVQKHFKKSTKPEAEVLADTDPEALHQMRVGMRRLRTALMVFESAIDLPKTVSETRIKKFAQVLGAVRDIDVMQAKLTERYRPDLDRKEHSIFLSLVCLKFVNKSLSRGNNREAHSLVDFIVVLFIIVGFPLVVFRHRGNA